MKYFKQINCNLSVIIPLIFLSCLACSGLAKATGTEKVIVFAAASTLNAVDEIGKLFSQQKKIKFVPSFASSSTLAKQIASGAPANIYISANKKWMSFLAKKGIIEKGTQCDLLGNSIVLIAPANAKNLKIDIVQGINLNKILKGKRLSMGDPDHVPAGIYGKQALIYLGAWDTIASMVIRAKDVRTALVFVEREESPLGIVYSTDAAISNKVKVAGIFPEYSHPPITYQAAIIKENSTKPGLAFYTFLKSLQARKIFQKYGFLVK